MPRTSVLVILLNCLTLAVTLVMNWLANALPLNGRTTGQISDSFATNLFAPAGYVFSIWGLIYVGLLAFTIYQLTPGGRRSGAVRRVGGWLAVANVANAVWIVFWHFEQFPATMAAMLVLLVSLCAIVRRLGVPGSAGSVADLWLVYMPFSVYLGWVSVATIANAAVVLLSVGWDGAPLSAATWAIIMLAFAAALGAWMVVRRGDVAFAAVLVWAFIGIAIKQEAVVWVPQVAWIGAGVLAGLAVWRLASVQRSAQTQAIAERTH